MPNARGITDSGAAAVWRNPWFAALRHRSHPEPRTAELDAQENLFQAPSHRRLRAHRSLRVCAIVGSGRMVLRREITRAFVKDLGQADLRVEESR